MIDGLPRSQELTRREQDVMGHVMHGYTAEQSSRLLGIALGTTRTHRQNILTKLHAHNMPNAVWLYLGTPTVSDVPINATGIQTWTCFVLADDQPPTSASLDNGGTLRLESDGTPTVVLLRPRKELERLRDRLREGGR